MKPTLIFLHGGPGFSDYLETFFKHFSDKFEKVFYDQLKGSSVTVDDLCHQLDSVIDSTNGNVILAGHSWGGVLACEYSLRNPQKIHGLVIMSTGLCFEHWNDEFQNEKSRLGLTEASPEEVFLTINEREAWKSFLDETWKTFSEETFDSIYNSYVKNHDLRNKFSASTIPVILITGAKDIRFPMRIAAALQGLRKDMDTVIIQNAGHFPFLTKDHQVKIQKAIETKFIR